jgi:hypothetical protein
LGSQEGPAFSRHGFGFGRGKGFEPGHRPAPGYGRPDSRQSGPWGQNRRGHRGRRSR